jgi:hypothetical protein
MPRSLPLIAGLALPLAGACGGGSGSTASTTPTPTATAVDTCAKAHHCSPGRAHWSPWLSTGGAWAAQTGSYALLPLHDHDAMGWRYVLSSTPPQPPPVPQPM